jgi:hypothetical protein
MSRVNECFFEEKHSCERSLQIESSKYIVLIQSSGPNKFHFYLYPDSGNYQKFYLRGLKPF